MWKDEQIQSIIDNGNYIAVVNEIGEREGKKYIKIHKAFIYRRAELSELIFITNWLLLKLIIVDRNLFSDDLAF